MISDGKKYPSIADAKALTEKYALRGVIVFSFDEGKFGYASYGETKKWCKELAGLGDWIYHEIEIGAVCDDESADKS